MGLSWFVQEPFRVTSGCIPSCTAADWIARVDAAIYSKDWSVYSVLHIGDCEIIPGVTYNVYACDPSDTNVCSDPILVGTQVKPGSFRDFGDTTGGVTSDLEMVPPDGRVGISDIQAWFLTKQNYGTPNLPQAHPTWMDLHGLGPGLLPNYVLGVSDLQWILFGFVRGAPWEYESGGFAPGNCP